MKKRLSLLALCAAMLMSMLVGCTPEAAEDRKSVV